MKAEYVNPFLGPAKNFWQKELGHPMEIIRLGAVELNTTTEEVTAVISVKGAVDGHVLYGFDTATAKNIAGVMMGDVVTDLDIVALSALGELGNMISGNASTELEQAGYQSRISPPSLYTTVGSKFSADHVVKQIIVVFMSGLGAVHVRIGLAERSSNTGDVGWLIQHGITNQAGQQRPPMPQAPALKPLQPDPSYTQP